MWDQEKKHLEKFNEILAESRVRPTALLPLWNIAGFVLGKEGLLRTSMVLTKYKINASQTNVLSRFC